MLSALSNPAAMVAVILDSGLPLGLAFLYVIVCLYCSDKPKMLSSQTHASAPLAAGVFIAPDTKFAD